MESQVFLVKYKYNFKREIQTFKDQKTPEKMNYLLALASTKVEKDIIIMFRNHYRV
jgi:hypothetical protein